MLSSSDLPQEWSKEFRPGEDLLGDVVDGEVGKVLHVLPNPALQAAQQSLLELAELAEVEVVPSSNEEEGLEVGRVESQQEEMEQEVEGWEEGQQVESEVKEAEGVVAQLLDELLGEVLAGNNSCDTCAKTFSTKRKLQDHMRSLHKNPGDCATCGKFFSSRKKLVKHQAVHKPPSHQCDRCAVLFKSRRTLDRHMVTSHGDERPGGDLLPCPKCPRSFTTKSGLGRHVKMKHSTQIRPPSTIRAKYLSRPRKFICRTCCTGFKREGSLKEHIKRKHGGQKQVGRGTRLSCNLCSEVLKFSTHKSLEEHRKKVHSGEACYPCTVCDKAFKSSNSMSKHRSVVHGGHSYQCRGEVGGGLGCGKLLRTKYSLKKHLKICGKVKGKQFLSTSRWTKARRASKRADEFNKELEGLGEEERMMVTKRLATTNPSILDSLAINPFTTQDIIEVSFKRVFVLLFFLFNLCYFSSSKMQT